MSRATIALCAALAYFAGVGAIAALGVTAVDRMLATASRELSKPAGDAAAVPAEPSTGSASGAAAGTAPAEQRVLAGKGTPNPVQSVQYWTNKAPPPPPKPVQSLGIFGLMFQEPEPPPPPQTFATVCVRLCDGYYFPVSFATTPESFGRDERKCQSTCGSQAKLFVYRNPGSSPENMQDLRGQAYSRLPTAFQYRTSYNESCKCKPHPWEEAARDQHRAYALQDSARKGDKKAAVELAALKSKAGDSPVAPTSVASRAPTQTVGANDTAPKTAPPGMMALGAQKPAPAPKVATSSNPAWRAQAFNSDR